MLSIIPNCKHVFRPITIKHNHYKHHSLTPAGRVKTNILLFDVAAVGLDHFTETAWYRLTRVSQDLLGKLLPCSDDGSQQRGFRTVAGLVDLLLHETPKAEVSWVEVGASGRPFVRGDEWDVVS